MSCLVTARRLGVTGAHKLQLIKIVLTNGLMEVLLGWEEQTD